MTTNKNCNPFVKEKLLKGLSLTEWHTSEQIAVAGGMSVVNIYSNINVLVRDGSVASRKRGRERVYRLTGDDPFFDPPVGPAVVVIDPANYPQFYVNRIAALLKKYYMGGKTVTVTVVEGDLSKDIDTGE